MSIYQSLTGQSPFDLVSVVETPLHHSDHDNTSDFETRLFLNLRLHSNSLGTSNALSVRVDLRHKSAK